MKELEGKHSASKRNDPYSKSTMDLSEKIEKLRAKMTEDSELIKN